MVRFQCFHCCGLRSVSGQGTEIQQATCVTCINIDTYVHTYMDTVIYHYVPVRMAEFPNITLP